MKNMRISVAAVVMFLFVFVSVLALGQDKVTLQFKGEQGKILKYRISAGGAMKMDLNGLPMPGAKMTGDNLSGDAEFIAFLDTISVEDGTIVFDMRGTIAKIALGELLRLEGLLGDTDKSFISAKVTLNKFGKVEDLTIESSPMGEGGIGEGKGKDMMSGLGIDIGELAMGTLLPMLVSVLPPLFPENPVAVGETWSQSFSTEDVGLPFLPKITFDFKLDAVDKGVAKISYTSKGTFDASFLKSFLAMIPEIPVGENTMTIKDIKLVVPWDIKGTMDFNIEGGRIESMSSHKVFDIDGGASIDFVLPDKTKKGWQPVMKIKIEADSGAKFEGYGTREEFDALTPKEEEGEDEEDIDEL
ncbi:MAG: DUF6263 family protein [bacterium]